MEEPHQCSAFRVCFVVQCKFEGMALGSWSNARAHSGQVVEKEANNLTMGLQHSFFLYNYHELIFFFYSLFICEILSLDIDCDIQ